MGLGRCYAADFGYRLELPARPHPPCIPGRVKFGVGNLEVLQLGINSGELLAKEVRLLCGQRLVNGHGDLRADFSRG